METLKPVVGYEELYMASSLGKIWSIRSSKYLKSTLRNGYPSVSLSKNNHKKTRAVHTLIAKAFLTIPENITKPVVNHKNGIKTDDRLENLEWTNHRGNAIHAQNNMLKTPHTRKVSQYKDGVLIATYNSIAEAEQMTGINGRNIVRYCKHQRTCKDFDWKYDDETEETLLIETVESKEIPGYEKYRITPSGEIYNTKYNKWMKLKKTEEGYLQIGLRSKGMEEQDMFVHRLVALLYIPNDDMTLVVNHKNGLKQDNRVENLEWVTQAQNMLHAYNCLNINTFKRKVVQIDVNNNIIAVFDSIKDANIATGVDNSSIVRVCKGKQKSAGGWMWKYHDGIDVQ